MRQKFTFTIDDKKETITLQEANEADPGNFITVHEERYDLDELKDAVAADQEKFVETLRRKNLFPPIDLAIKFHAALIPFFEAGDENKIEVAYEDVEAFPNEAAIEVEADEEDVEELGDILKADAEDLSEDDIKEIDGDDDTPRFQPDDNSEHEN